VVIRASADNIAIAQVADDVVSRPSSAASRGSPVIGSESFEDVHEPLPLLGVHLEQVLWIEVAQASGRQ
jgi:hypothetical protein